MGKWNNAFRWGRRGLTASLAIALALSAFGWNWERSEQQAFNELGLLPPGEVVHLGAQRLHVVAQGEGSPGVLFISGLGDDWRIWEQIADRLADSARVVRYDRPGLGWSPPREGALTLDSAVQDIGDLLANPEIFQEPPVLVGHSLGGAIARQFALEYPTQIAGLILLDPTPSHAMPASMNLVGSMLFRVGFWSSAVGLGRWQHYRANPQSTREQQLRSAFLNANGAKAREVLREFQGAARSESIEPRQGVLAQMPLTLLAAPTFAPPGFGRASAELDAAKRFMAQESMRGRLVEVATGHYIHLEDPDTVVAEVLKMLGGIREKGGDMQTSG